MMLQPSISVALCTYNGATFLSEQLESIANQTVPPNEVIICDDCSSDGTCTIVEEFAERAHFPVRLTINEQNLGSNRNFERAVSLCSSDIIMLSDQDDVWESKKLETYRRIFQTHPEAGYVFSDAELIDIDGRSVGRSLWDCSGFTSMVLREFASGAQVSVLLRRSVVTGATMGFRSSLRTSVLPFCAELVHDYWISLVASCVGATGIPVSERLLRYRQHSNQQIGAARKSLLARVSLLRHSSEDEREKARLGMLQLRNRLLSAASERIRVAPSTIGLVEEKLEHCSRRTAVHKQRGLAKWSGVASEIATGRYTRFSNSWRSVISDICF